MFNFDELKKEQVSTKQRELMGDILLELLLERCGAENVSQVGSNKIAVNLGLRTLKDGTKGEVCSEITFTAKPFDDYIVESSGKPVSAYERQTLADDYADKVKKDKEKAEKKAKEKAEREEKEKKLKEQKKREKEQRAKQNNDDNG